MSDIAQRLRDIVLLDSGIAYEAADEIERLQEELATVSNKLEMAEAVICGDGALITGLREELARATGMPTVTEAARNIALEQKVYELREELAARKERSRCQLMQKQESCLQTVTHL
jgi:Tfp pilus assembly PilM family ATPase